MNDPQESVLDPKLKVFLVTRLKELETLIEIAIAKVDVLALLEIETEHQILATMWRALDCAGRDANFLDRKGIRPELRPSIMNLLPEKPRSLPIKVAAVSDS